MLDLAHDRTITLAKVDPLQDAPGVADDVQVDLDDIDTGTAILVIRGGEEEGEYFVLSEPTISVGRADSCHISFDDITVSRHHSEIFRQDGTHFIRDLGSLNGTYVNQRRVDVVELRQGDEVQIGKFRLVYLDNGQDSA